MTALPALLARLHDLKRLLDTATAELTALEGIVHALPQPSPPAARRGGRPRLDPPPRTCVTCGRTFTRHPTERAHAYRNRRTCREPACIKAAIARTHSERHPPRPPRDSKPRATRTDRQPITERPCPVCKRPIPRGNLVPSQYALRRTCSRACSNELRSRNRRKQPPAPRWTSDELTILKHTYPTSGPAGTQAALEDAGHPHRTIEAITTTANRQGLAINTTPPATPETVLELVRDYRGLPLDANDVAEELRIPRDRARSMLNRLRHAGSIRARPNPNGRTTLFYAPTEDAA